DDNPYLVFESLNAKGRPLTQADLIRNYFFMRININDQQRIYNELWHPMEERLGDKLTEYIRHFLMCDGAFVRQADIYHSLKERVDVANALSYLKDLAQKSCFYQKLIFPEKEEDSLIRKYLLRLNRIEVTTAYPLLLNIYTKYSCNQVTKEQFVEVLKLLENFLIRRFICSYPTNQLNKIFLSILPLTANRIAADFVETIKNLLQTKSYPKDIEFRQKVNDSKLYGSGDRTLKTKLILEAIEEYFGHKEIIQFDNLTIEHVMPQTMTEWWKNHLGEDWEATYELYIDNIGNLTLTAYNSELSNSDFNTKKEFYASSNLQLNAYFIKTGTWKKQDIENRSYFLADLLVKIWPNFGSEDSGKFPGTIVTGTTPQALWILGQFIRVNSWREVLESTLNTIADIDSEKFEILPTKFPAYIGINPNRFRKAKVLKNGYFFETNLSAKDIRRLCLQALESIELGAEDWKVQTT
ncbi:MAG: HNH endonuclease family protein, partial [Methanococcaceae archaeon]